MIAAELEPLLEPLETFEAIRRRAVRLGERLCDLSYANPYEGVAPATRTVLRSALERERLLDLQYAPFGGHTLARRAVADALAASHALEFGHQDVILTPGAMAALHLALRAAGTPGDEVVIPVPCWLDYPLYARHLGLTPVTVPLQEPDFQLDLERIEAAIGPRTAAVLISQPSNPAGQCYAREALAALAEVLARAERRLGRAVTLISDETHRDFVTPGTYVSGAASWPSTLIVYSFGKYHYLQGQRLGYLAVSPRHPQRAPVSSGLARLTRITGFCTPTALMQAAIPGLLALRHDHGPVERWRERLTTGLTAAGYRVARPVATLFVYVATPGGRGDFDFIRDLARAGVLALPAPVFHHKGYFRLSLTGSEAMLGRSLAILRDVLSP
ncbi:MAG TPA: aminotransferase class I/II-fold pyridoxal phosphate-dependent enzyme [Vicinamibacteria bacterium]